MFVPCSQSLIDLTSAEREGGGGGGGGGETRRMDGRKSEQDVYTIE